AASPGPWESVISSNGVPFSTNSTEFFASGAVKSRTNPEGKRTSYPYWPDGQLMTVTDALTNATYYEYDLAGRQKLVGDALQHTNAFIYDPAGRQNKIIFADGTWTSNVFNIAGQRLGQID